MFNVARSLGGSAKEDHTRVGRSLGKLLYCIFRVWEALGSSTVCILLALEVPWGQDV